MIGNFFQDRRQPGDGEVVDIIGRILGEEHTGQQNSGRKKMQPQTEEQRGKRAFQNKPFFVVRMDDLVETASAASFLDTLDDCESPQHTSICQSYPGSG